MKLYGYWRSSSAYRVRIALNLKGIEVDHAPVHLVKDGGQQHGEAFRRLNPAERVPALEIDDGTVITQSLAIIAYLDETRPEPPLLPSTPTERAACRAFALAVACDIQPLGNLSVLQHVKNELGGDPAAWAARWITLGFGALESAAATRGGGPFLFGGAPTLAEICLVPQVYNARRFDIDMDAFPHLQSADEAARATPAFAAAAPERQADAGE